MRFLIASAAIYIAFVAVAGATGASWPITPFVDYPAAQTIDPDGAVATVHITVGDDASAIEVEVYGLDGMRAGDDNMVRVHRDQLPKGASFAFDVAIHPGAGRSSLVVSARARFVRAGAGGTLRDFPFGEKSAEQLREHTRCVRQDPDGVWIRVEHHDRIEHDYGNAGDDDPFQHERWLPSLPGTQSLASLRGCRQATA
jgi:hypothetical protein